MKKLMTAWLLVFACFAAAFPASADSAAQISIKSPSQLPRAGDEFTVTVDISQNPGFCAIDITLSFDKSKLECTKINLGDVLDGLMAVKNPSASDGAIISAATLDPALADGVIAKYYFTATQDIDEFDFELKNVSLTDGNLNDLAYTVVGATEDDTPEVTTPEVDTAPSNPTTPVVPDETDEPVVTPDEPDEAAEPEDEAADLTDTPENTEDATLPKTVFADMAGHWAEEYVNLATEYNLFKGDENGNFNPDQNVTRSQFITVLWRMAGSVPTEDPAPFTDIDSQIPEFKSAIAWGYKNGYINGVSDTEFDPNGTLTREAGMKILHFYSGGMVGDELMFTDIYNGTFTDSTEISDWAKKSMYWGVYHGLISGTTPKTLSPQGTATRAQLAKILVTYHDTYNK